MVEPARHLRACRMTRVARHVLIAATAAVLVVAWGFVDWMRWAQAQEELSW